MSRATVHEILERIEQLSAEDRRALDELLSWREEREWREEAARARRAARKKGIGQCTIDQAVLAARRGASRRRS
jgi:hypothetical protein